MAWLVLIVSGLFEAVWAAALSKSDGFTRLVPSVIFAIAAFISMFGLSYGMKSIPLGTAYAAWVAIGAVATLAYAIFSGAESASPLKLVCVTGIIVCVIGLKLAK